MSGFPIVDLVIGLIFIYFVLSILTSAVVEMILTRLKVRGKFMKLWLLTIFDKNIMQPDGGIMPLGQAIMDHCATTALSPAGEATSFIDSKNFVAALIEKLTYDINSPVTDVAKDLDALIEKLKTATSVDGTPMLSTELLRTLLIFGADAKAAAPVAKDANGQAATTVVSVNNATPPPQKDSMDLFKEKLEKWFDTSMDRVTGKMKSKYIRPFTFFVGLVVVVSLNADTVQMSKYLYDHKEETKQFADKALVAVQNIDSTGKKDTLKNAALKQALANVDTLKASVPKGFPFGWEQKDIDKTGYQELAKQHIVGWLATVLAIMLGAPFWFDLLNKIGNLRGSGAKPTSTTDKQPATT